jgi:hypothetical protein
VSTNSGITWQLADCSVWLSAGSAAAISPGKDRVVFAANLQHSDRGHRQQQLLVKEFDLVEGKRNSRLPSSNDEPRGTETEQDDKQGASSDNATTNPGE